MLTFGERLKEARKTAGFTQRQLADKIEVSNTSISNWEKGVSCPDPDTIQHLCWALNVQPNYFFSMDPPHVTNFMLDHQNGHQVTLPQLSSDELDFIEKFRSLDKRGQATVLAVLEHEFNNVDESKSQEYEEGYQKGYEDGLEQRNIDRFLGPQDWDDC